jgi:excisionase family DNA binding protein
MFTTRELAKFLNVHINTVRRWSDQGVIKSYRIGPRGDRRFSKDDVLSFLAANLQQPQVKVSL